MSDNLHEFNDEILEQDQIITDLTALTGRVSTNETDITAINNLNIANKFAGTVSSGLKTLIEGNDTDITNIETKTDFITVSQAVDLDTMESNIATNNAKVGITTTEQNKLSNISVSSAVNLNTMNTAITTNTNAIDAIELKTDFISVSQNVNLDSMESDILSNTSSAGTNSANITNILNNTISSTLKTAVDSIPNKLNNNADDILAGELKVYKTSDDNHLSVVCDAPNEAVLSVGGNESVQGTALINFGQGITHSTRRGTFGGFLSYEGDSNTEVGANTRFLQDTIHMGFFTSGAYYPTFHFNNSSADRNVFFRDGIYVRDKVTTANEYTMNGVIHCDETCRSTTGNLTGWKPTGTTFGTSNIRKVMLESPLDEGSGLALSEQGMCMWSADNGLYLVDEDSVSGTSYSGFYYHINQSGTVSTSDRNIKRNIRDLSFNRSFCDIINDIEPVLFNWKPHYNITDASGNETERYIKHREKWEAENVGVIAQDLPTEVKQYLMSGDENDCGHDKPLGVDYVKLTMYLIGAVKELKREIEILKQ